MSNMAKTICADRSCDRVGQDDLEFIKDMKKVPSQKNLASNPSSKDLQIYLGMRRNSSFAEYFEGDLSQNLLSRSHFPRRDSAAAVKNDTVDAIVKQIRTEDTNSNLGLGIAKVEGGEGRKKKLSQVTEIITNIFGTNIILDTTTLKLVLQEKQAFRRSLSTADTQHPKEVVEKMKMVNPCHRLCPSTSQLQLISGLGILICLSHSDTVI